MLTSYNIMVGVKRGRGGKKGGKPSAIAQKALEARLAAEAEEEARRKEEEEARLKEEQEEKERQEAEKLRKLEEERFKKEQAEKRKELKKLGLIKTKKQLEEEKRNEEAKRRFMEMGMVDPEAKPKSSALPAKKKKHKKPTEQPKPENIEVETLEEQKDELEAVDDWEALLEAETKPTETPSEPSVPKAPKSKIPKNQIPVPTYKSPIICILGHVDTGKTKLLDKIRHTNVQTGEAGGITQQIGATVFPSEAIEELTSKLPNMNVQIDVPGVLIIDTPGHASFSNLRSRGSSLCDLGILVVDIMHGLEQQTLESLEMLRRRNIPFVVALNKIDRMYGWKGMKDEAFFTTFNQQPESAQEEFRRRARDTSVLFAEQGLNAALYYENPDPDDYISLVPTSAITGEGIPDILGLLVDIAQKRLPEKIKYRQELQATVMEVKLIEGLGTTIDVILANGVIREGDTIVVAGFNGPIVTHIRALVTPQPLKEMRVKGDYIHHKWIQASMGVKICAHGLEQAMAGTPLYVAETPEDIPELEEEVQRDMSQVFKYISKKGEGVHVQASTMGSLEALLEFLKDSKIPVSGVSVGPVHRKDVLKAQGQIEKGNRTEYATILAFDVKVNQEAQEYAESVGVKIFTAEIIYHLFDSFTQYVKEIRDREKQSEGKGKDAVFPCVLKIVMVIRTKDPMILGVDVVGGILKLGTPVAVPDRGNLVIGKVASMEVNNKPVTEARSGGSSIAIKISPSNAEQAHVTIGRHFDESNQLCSFITRASIDALKEYFRDEMTMDDWRLVKVLKTKYGID
mgnify:CR=1 FL=1